MGNSGFRRIFYPLDYVDTPYDSFHELQVMDLDKSTIELKSLCQGKISLIVNLASENVKSQEILKNLMEIKSTFQEKNIEILGFPSNQFGNERRNFNVLKEEYKNLNFPVFSKVEVNGKFIHPVFKFLKRRSKLYDFILQGSNQVKNDFSMFIVSDDGEKVISYFDKPPSIEVMKKIIEENVKQTIKET